MLRKNRQPDFSGWATVNDILCSDGRTIRRNAFAENDGEVVPLVGAVELCALDVLGYVGVATLLRKPAEKQPRGHHVE